MSMGLARSLEGIPALLKQAEDFLQNYLSDKSFRSDENRAAFDRMLIDGTYKIRLTFETELRVESLVYEVKGLKKHLRLEHAVKTLQESLFSWEKGLDFRLISLSVIPAWVDFDEDVDSLDCLSHPQESVLFEGDHLHVLVELGVFAMPDAATAHRLVVDYFGTENLPVTLVNHA